METIIVVGGGASGLVAAGILSQSDNYDVIILDQASKLARKVLASGNGRCNLSHTPITMDHYSTNHPLITKIVKEFDVVEFFKKNKMMVRYDHELIYPYSLSSLTVKNTLLSALKDVSIITDCTVYQIIKNNQYEVKTNQGTYYGDKVIIASGSPASELSGVHNLDMLKDFSIKIIPFKESLVQLETKPVYKSLKGQRVKCKASLYDHNKKIDEVSGEVLFTDYGLSGICIMQLSRHIYRLKQPVIHLDLLPEYDLSLLKDYQIEGLYHEKVAKVIIEKQLNIKDLSFKVEKSHGMKHAQVCHGGVSLDEIDHHLQLKKYPGIYVIGEALDVDGDCGGYNLHFAFASGEYVARAIKEEIC